MEEIRKVQYVVGAEMEMYLCVRERRGREWKEDCDVVKVGLLIFLSVSICACVLGHYDT